MDGGEKVSRGFVVARGDRSELLELAEEVFNEVTCFVSGVVIAALSFAIAYGWDYRSFANSTKQIDHTLFGVICFICQQSVGLHLRQQNVGAFEIMRVARGQIEGQRIAQSIDQGVNFSAPPAYASPDRLVLAVFF